MNRTDRLVAMVMYFQGRRLVRAEELARHFEVSIRTVYRDVAALCEAGVPLTGEAGVGYTLVKGYHLPPVSFTADEAMALFVGGEMVQKFTDSSLSSAMSSALLKLRAVLPQEQQDDIDRLGRGMLVAGNGALRHGLDQRVLLPIQQAVISRRVLRFDYRVPSRNEMTRRDVEPLGVVFHNGAWYLVGWCRLRDGLRQFKLERLGELVVTSERFSPRPDFSLDRYLNDAMPTEKMLTARIWFRVFAFDRARRESFNELTEVVERDDGFEATVRTFSLQWLARWILTFGDGARAVAPEELRECVVQEARQILDNHKPNAASETAGAARESLNGSPVENPSESILT